MLNPAQNQLFNRLMSETNSFAHHAGSQGAAVIKTESPIGFVDAAKSLGFDVDTEAGLVYDCFHGEGLHIIFHPRLENWTIGTTGKNAEVLKFVDAG